MPGRPLSTPPWVTITSSGAVGRATRPPPPVTEGDVAGAQIGQEPLVVDLDDLGGAGVLPGTSRIRCPSGHEALVGNAAGADLRAGQVDEDADALTGVGGHLADPVKAAERLVEGAVRETQAGHVHSLRRSAGASPRTRLPGRWWR